MHESSNSKPLETASVLSYRKRKLRESGRSLKSVIISGVGFLADAYDLFVIDFVVAILSITAKRKPTSSEVSLLVSTTHAGAALGQIFFGVGADFIGRRTMFITTATLIICGSIISSLVGIGYTISDHKFNVFIQLAICRFFLGFGIGGEYPLSATVTSEADTDSEEDSKDAYSKGILWYLTHKPNSIAVVFSMQGLGMLLSPLFVWAFLSMGLSLELTWRFCLAVGSIPSAIAFFFRWHMHESVAFKKAQREYSFAESIVTGGTGQSERGFPKQSLARSSIEIDSCKNTSIFSPKNLENPDNSQSHLSNMHKLLEASNNPKYDAEDNYMNLFEQSHENNPKIENDATHTEEQEMKKKSCFYSICRHFRRRTRPSNRFPESGLALSPESDLMKPTFASFIRHLRYVFAVLKQNKTLLLATSATWFLIDVTLYGAGSFKSAIVKAWQPDEMLVLVEQVKIQAKFGALIALIAIPGYVLSICFIHITGTRKLQIYGFLSIGIVFLVLGLTQLFELKNNTVSTILFGLTFLASNFGPNTTTFILPTQLYPTLVRATCHGFSAAMGKVGGMLGTACFPFLLDNGKMAWLLIICAVVAFIGIPFSLLIPRDHSKKEFLKNAEAVSLSIAARQNPIQNYV